MVTIARTQGKNWCGIYKSIHCPPNKLRASVHKKFHYFYFANLLLLFFRIKANFTQVSCNPKTSENFISASGKQGVPQKKCEIDIPVSFTIATECQFYSAAAWAAAGKPGACKFPEPWLPLGLADSLSGLWTLEHWQVSNGNTLVFWQNVLLQ